MIYNNYIIKNKTYRKRTTNGYDAERKTGDTYLEIVDECSQYKVTQYCCQCRQK
jgi:hypothetical protein